MACLNPEIKHLKQWRPENGIFKVCKTALEEAKANYA